MSEYCLHLKNVSPDADTKDIRGLFSKFDIPYGGVSIHGGPEGTAFVSFSRPEHLLEASSYNNIDFMGRTLVARVIKTSERDIALEKLKQELKSQIQTTETRTVKLMSMETIVVQRTSVDSLQAHHKSIESLPGLGCPPWLSQQEQQQQQQQTSEQQQPQTSEQSREYVPYNQTSQNTEAPSTWAAPAAQLFPIQKDRTVSSNTQQWQKQQSNPALPPELFAHSSSMYGGGEAKKMRLSTGQPDEGRFYDSEMSGNLRSQQPDAGMHNRDRGDTGVLQGLDAHKMKLQMEIEIEERIAREIQEGLQRKRELVERLQKGDSGSMASTALEKSTIIPQRSDYQGESRPSYSQPASYPSQTDALRMQPQACQDFPGRSMEVSTFDKREEERYQMPRTTEEQQYDRFSQAELSAGLPPRQNYESQGSNVYPGPKPYYEGSAYSAPRTQSEYQTASVAARPDEPLPQTGQGGQYGGYNREYPGQPGYTFQHGDLKSATPRLNEPHTQSPYEGVNQGRLGGYSGLRTQREDQTSAATCYNEPQSQALHKGQYEGYSQAPLRYLSPRPDAKVQQTIIDYQHSGAGLHGVDRFPPNPRTGPDPYEAARDGGRGMYGVDRHTSNPRPHLDHQQKRYDDDPGVYGANRRTANLRRPFDPYQGGHDGSPRAYGGDRHEMNPRRPVDHHWGRLDDAYGAEQDSMNQNQPGYLQMTNANHTVTASQVRWFFAGYQISPMGVKIKRDNTNTTVYVKFDKLEDAHACFQMNKRLLNGRVVNIKLVSASVFQASNEPTKPVSAPLPVQPPYKGTTKPNLYYVALKFLPQNATACGVWEKFGGASGPSLGALLLDAKGHRMEKMAFVAFENEKDRDAAVPLFPDARSWTHKAVYASYINAPMQSKMYKTTPTGDVELNAEEIATLRQKFLSNSYRKQNLGHVKSDWEMEIERQTLNAISRVLFKLKS